ncbi:sugar-binding transcriptional regulator [Pseudolysinimonas sp.]|jgi:deoxyribonucleoside regulator|uniref:sugar-binding transcriptional regulator n=1 Tax=Pseudolysinimonas sp. TaxID=2680009 RepID=UPI0037841883
MSAPTHDPRTLAALRAAQMYYLQDLTMETIAAELHASRSTVSRLLSHARETGLVDIQVRSPFEAGAPLERALAERFRVVAHVVPAPATLSDVDRLERVALTAARLLGRYVDSNMTIGVAWGSTMGAISRHLVPKELHNTLIVQLNGAGNSQTTGIEYASEILRRFSDAYSARVQQFPVPALFDDPLTKQAFWRERATRRLVEIQSRMDIAVFGLGSPFAGVPSHVYVGGYLDDVDYRSLGADGVVGDVATVFYRVDGSYRDVALNARATGPEFEVLRRVARRVCVVAGEQKLASLQGALAAGIVTDVVLDEGLARELLANA